MNVKVIRSLIILGALLVLGSVNYSIYAKERIKSSGAVIYLELAPIDPRSLMLGDYMALRFRLADAMQLQRTAAGSPRLQRGSTVSLQIDARRVATLNENETDNPLRMRYRIRDGQIWLGTNAYFFEEGTARRFVAARYGEFRLDLRSGEAVLVGMRDENLRRL
jgi:uncharacterized membrane-anchored protein